jgi:hypothetical protein
MRQLHALRKTMRESSWRSHGIVRRVDYIDSKHPPAEPGDYSEEFMVFTNYSGFNVKLFYLNFQALSASISVSCG